MIVAVFGANGRVGSLVVDELLSQGHQVRAMVYGSHALVRNEKLVIIEGDIYSQDDVRQVLVGAEAIISALGSWGTPKKDILSAGMRNIIPVAKEESINRIISLTGADARAPGDELTLLHRVSHALLKIVGGKVLRDGEDHMGQLAESDLEYTVLRSPIMTESGPTKYLLGDSRPAPWATINRHAVAMAMVDQLDSRHVSERFPYISQSL